MFKGFAVSAALLLLLSSAAVATTQVQGFVLGQTNSAAVLGEGAAGNINATTVAVDQFATGPCHSVGYQGTAGSLIQAAGAVGMCGLFEVCQAGGGYGLQSQIPGTDIQNQKLDAWLIQDVDKIGGQGSALGLQTFVGIQTQLSFNPWGGSANVQGISASVYDAVGGGPGGATTVGGTAGFTAGQY